MSTIQRFLCKIDPRRSAHLANDLRILPCDGIGCLDCIRKSLDFFRVFECPFCKQNHVIADLDKDLKLGSYREYELKRLLPDISSELRSGLHEQISKLGAKRSEIKCLMENLFDFIEQEMLVRIESLKSEFDNCGAEAIERLESLESEVKCYMKTLNKPVFCLDSQKQQGPAASGPAPSGPAFSLKTLEFQARSLRSAYEEAVSSVNKASYKIKSIRVLRDLDLDGNNVNVIGKLRSPTIRDLDFECMKTCKANVIDLAEYVNNLTGLCQLEHNRIAVLDNFQNKILIFDLNFGFLKSVGVNDLKNIRTARISFHANLYSVHTNYSENATNDEEPRRVYINNMERNEIIVIDESLSRLKTIIKPLNPKTKRSIFEIDLDEKNLFVLDNLSRRIRKFQEDGTFTWIDLALEIKENQELNDFLAKLDRPHDLVSIPNLFAVKNGVIALYMPIVNEIQIVDLKTGKSRSKIVIDHEEKLSSICFAYNNLVVFSKQSGRLQVYKETDGSFGIVFERIFKNLVQFDYDNKITKTTLGSSFLFGHKSMEFLDNRLFILYSESNLAVVIECH